MFLVLKSKKQGDNKHMHQTGYARRLCKRSIGGNAETSVDGSGQYPQLTSQEPIFRAQIDSLAAAQK